MAPAFLGRKYNLLGIGWSRRRAGEKPGGVKNPGVPAVLFQDILFTGASLRPVVLKSDP